MSKQIKLGPGKKSSFYAQFWNEENLLNATREQNNIILNFLEFLDDDVSTDEDLSVCCGSIIINGRCFDCKDNVR